jgi:hypothetical protein
MARSISSHFFEPLASAEISAGRTVTVRERRTKADWAVCIRRLLGEHYPEAEKVILVMENLNTHCIKLEYALHLEPAEGRRLAERLEIHYMPEHGSWLNMAEIEQKRHGAAGAGPPRAGPSRVPDQQAMAGVTTAWAGGLRPKTRASN